MKMMMTRGGIIIITISLTGHITCRCTCMYVMQLVEIVRSNLLYVHVHAAYQRIVVATPVIIF